MSASRLPWRFRQEKDGSLSFGAGGGQSIDPTCKRLLARASLAFVPLRSRGGNPNNYGDPGGCQSLPELPELAEAMRERERERERERAGLVNTRQLIDPRETSRARKFSSFRSRGCRDVAARKNWTRRICGRASAIFLGRKSGCSYSYSQNCSRRRNSRNSAATIAPLSFSLSLSLSFSLAFVDARARFQIGERERTFARLKR